MAKHTKVDEKMIRLMMEVSATEVWEALEFFGFEEEEIVEYLRGAFPKEAVLYEIEYRAEILDSSTLKALATV